MSNDVKITTRISLMELLAPFSCVDCGQLGRPLCGCCKKYILEQREKCCIKCKNADCVCADEERWDGLWCVGWREGSIKKLIEEYKYNSARLCGDVLAELLSDVIPCLGCRVIVVPLPTIAKHIRQRGFDHTLRMCKKLAKMRGWKCESVLERRNKTVQVGATAERRKNQAAEAYGVRRKLEIDEDAIYLLVDDVWTTGASMEAARKVLMKAGIKNIAGAVVAAGR